MQTPWILLALNCLLAWLPEPLLFSSHSRHPSSAPFLRNENGWKRSARDVPGVALLLLTCLVLVRLAAFPPSSALSPHTPRTHTPPALERFANGSECCSAPACANVWNHEWLKGHPRVFHWEPRACGYWQLFKARAQKEERKTAKGEHQLRFTVFQR